MYGRQFMHHTGSRPGQICGALQFWRGRIKIVMTGA